MACEGRCEVTDKTPEQIAPPEVRDLSDPVEGSGPLSVRCQTNPRAATRDAEAGSQPRATERHRIAGIAHSGQPSPEEIAEGLSHADAFALLDLATNDGALLSEMDWQCLLSSNLVGLTDLGRAVAEVRARKAGA